MANVEEYKEGMNTFIDSLNSRKRAEEAANIVKNSDAYRSATIRAMENDARNKVAAKVFLTLYRDAVPVDPSLRITYADDIEKKMLNYIEGSGYSNVYDFLSVAASKGSVPAKDICEAATNGARDFAAKYYSEQDVTIDDIEDKAADLNSDSEEISCITDKIKSDMNIEQVSAMIENNVKETIANEIRISKQEDAKLSDLEASLEQDDSVMEDCDIESALIRAGFKPNSVYEPSLFNAIMIGEVSKLMTEDCSDEAKQKKAFYESTKELTVLQTLQSLGIISITPSNIRQYTYKYTSQN